jgi:prophage regulatory protein
MRITGLGRDTLYRMIRDGKFPQQRRITERASAWREDEIRAWIDSRPIVTAGSPNPQAKNYIKTAMVS